MIWKDIPDYEDLYQVSECGKVKSIERPHNYRGVKKEKILKPCLNEFGYEVVNLWKDGVGKNYKVHRLVMYAHSHVETELTVNHIDENKRNNHISNLEYCTSAENVRKYCKNNPDKVSERANKIGKANKEKLGHKYLDTQTGIIYDSIIELSIMMYKTGQAESKWTWDNILRKGKPQDRFVKV
jgi:hypothetical protein